MAVLRDIHRNHPGRLLQYYHISTGVNSFEARSANCGMISSEITFASQPGKDGRLVTRAGSNFQYRVGWRNLQ